MDNFEQSLVSGMNELMNKEGEFIHPNFKKWVF